MKELDLQRLIVDAVNGAGGRAFKLNNRFMIGYSDLLVKLPPRAQAPLRGAFHNDFPAGLLEVKQRARPKTAAQFQLDVTHAQGVFLQAAHDAGMPCGMASFLQEGSGSGLKLWLQVQTWGRFTLTKNKTDRGWHLPLGKSDARHNDILSALYNWHKEWREGK